MRLNKLKNIIDKCGFMMIKSVQWLLPSYNLLYPDTKFYDIFNKYESPVIFKLNNIIIP